MRMCSEEERIIVQIKGKQWGGGRNSERNNAKPREVGWETIKGKMKQGETGQAGKESKRRRYRPGDQRVQTAAPERS